VEKTRILSGPKSDPIIPTMNPKRKEKEKKEEMASYGVITVNEKPLVHLSNSRNG